MHGIPHKIVTDNGPTFCSEQFQTFMKTNGIKLIFLHLTTPPPMDLQQTIKQRVCQMQGLEPIQDKLKFLCNYRITPHTTTGVPSCELLMNW